MSKTSCLLMSFLMLFYNVVSNQDITQTSTEEAPTTFHQMATNRTESWRQQDMTTERQINLIPTFEDVDYYLSQERAKHFLDKFQNEIQRDMIREQLRSCPFTSLCGFYLNIPIFTSVVSCCQPCSCDYPGCFDQQTCCPDVIPEEFFEDLSADVITDPPAKLFSQKRCTLLHATYSRNFEQFSEYMYSTCPVGTNPSLEEKCTVPYSFETVSSITDIIPVQTENELYRNKFCAVCNNVSESSYLFWDAKLNFDEVNKGMVLGHDNEILRLVFKTNTCDLTFTKGLAKQFYSCPPSINICNVTGLWINYDPILERKCVLYTSVYIRHQVYDFQNIYCLQCNGFNVTSTECSDVDHVVGSSEFAFSGLLRLDNDETLSSIKDKGVQDKDLDCASDEEVYDDSTKTCVRISCSSLHKLENGHCHRLFDVIQSMTYTYVVRLTPVSNISLQESYTSTDIMLSDLYFSFVFDIFVPAGIGFDGNVCETRVLYAVDRHSLLTLVQGIDNLNVEYIDIKQSLSLINYHSPYNISFLLMSTKFGGRLILNNKEYNITIKDDFDDYKFQRSKQTDGFVLLNGTGDFILPASNTSSSQEIPKYDKYVYVPYLQDEYVLGAQFKSCPPDLTEQNIFHITDCVKVESKITFQKENLEGLSCRDYDRTIPYKEFSYKNANVINICLETHQRFAISKINGQEVNGLRNPVPHWTRVLSIILVSASLLCIFVTLLTYTVLPSLRNLPGKNTMSLSFNLFLAQLLYLVSSFSKFYVDSVQCIATGICLHFFWLATIMWMNVCTFHIKRTLTSKTVIQNEGCWRFLCYHLYAYFVAAVLVITNLITSYILTDGKSLGYGSLVCYISFNDMLQYTFVIPVFVAIAINFIMFLCVIISLKRLPQVKSNNSNKTRDRNDLVIFIKLSSLTGITWLFGFLYSWTGMSAFSYVFILLNATMGIFIFVSFVANHRVLSLCKQRFQFLVETTTLNEPNQARKYKANGT